MTLRKALLKGRTSLALINGYKKPWITTPDPIEYEDMANWMMAVALIFLAFGFFVDNGMIPFWIFWASILMLTFSFLLLSIWFRGNVNRFLRACDALDQVLVGGPPGLKSYSELRDVAQSTLVEQAAHILVYQNASQFDEAANKLDVFKQTYNTLQTFGLVNEGYDPYFAEASKRVRGTTVHSVPVE